MKSPVRLYNEGLSRNFAADVASIFAIIMIIKFVMIMNTPPPFHYGPGSGWNWRTMPVLTDSQFNQMNGFDGICSFQPPPGPWRTYPEELGQPQFGTASFTTVVNNQRAIVGALNVPAGGYYAFWLKFSAPDTPTNFAYNETPYSYWCQASFSFNTPMGFVIELDRSGVIRDSVAVTIYSFQSFASRLVTFRTLPKEKVCSYAGGLRMTQWQLFTSAPDDNTISLWCAHYGS